MPSTTLVVDFNLLLFLYVIEIVRLMPIPYVQQTEVKTIMRGQWKKGWQAVALLAATAVVGLAQTTRMASPGAVNYVEGNATLDGQGLTQRAVGSAVAGPNQVISTTDGYVEVLLTPGAFLRIWHNSEVRVGQAGLTGVDLRLDRGLAMVEATEFVKGSTLQVAMDGATIQIDHTGLYAFDADQPSVRVLDGKAEVALGDKHATVKKGNELLLANEAPLKTRHFDKASVETEPLYTWSKVRGREASEANALLASRFTANTGWYGPGWYWNPYWSGYAFLPGTGMLYSPFGWGYYAPAFAFGIPWGYGFAPGYYGRGFYGHGVYGRVGGFRAGVRSARGSHSFGGHR